MDELSKLLVEMREDDVLAAVRAARQAGASATDVIGTLQDGMRAIGDKYSAGEYFLSELIMSAEIIKRALAELGLDETALDNAGGPAYILGTVRHDIHDIGKNIVASVLGANGFRVIDLGVDVPPESFVAAVREHNAGLVGLSCLLTTAFDSMGQTIEALRAAGLRDQLDIFVGGGPVTSRLAEQLGADAAGASAQEAVTLAERARVGERS